MVKYHYQGGDRRIGLQIITSVRYTSIIQIDRRWQRMDISLMRILPGVNLDKINKISNVYRKDKRGNRIRWKFIAWKDLYWENSIGHDDDYDSIMQFGNRYAPVYSFRSNHIAIIGGYIEFHQYLYGIYDETF